MPSDHLEGHPTPAAATSRSRVYMIAGPNGAGKTTFARSFLPDDAGCTTFINADLIAAGLSPFRPEAAAAQAMRLMAEAIHDCAARKVNFAVETTLAGRSYIGLIKAWRAQGYVVKLIFLRLPSPEMALARVRQRVAMGGHHVPDDIVRRRFQQGWMNFETVYGSLVDAWAVYDSSGAAPVLIAEREAT